MNGRWDSALLPHLCLFCHPQGLDKLYHCETPFTERPHEDLDAQRLRITYKYEQVHARTARPVGNNSSLPRPYDAEAGVLVQVRNDVKLNKPTIVVVKRDDELPS